MIRRVIRVARSAEGTSRWIEAAPHGLVSRSGSAQVSHALYLSSYLSILCYSTSLAEQEEIGSAQGRKSKALRSLAVRAPSVSPHTLPSSLPSPRPPLPATSSYSPLPNPPAFKMAAAPASDQLANLKSLVSQLQAKIERLESQAAPAAPAAASPAAALRLVLMGPPGAGTLLASLRVQ